MERARTRSRSHRRANGRQISFKLWKQELPCCLASCSSSSSVSHPPTLSFHTAPLAPDGGTVPWDFAPERYSFRHRMLGGGFPFWVTSSLTRGLMTSTHNPKFLGPNPKHHLPYSHLHPALRAPRVLGADGPSGGSCKLPISTTRSPSKSVV